MPSKKTNPWIKFLQSYTKKQQKTNKNYTYKNAIGDKNAKMMYKKMKGGFFNFGGEGEVQVPETEKKEDLNTDQAVVETDEEEPAVVETDEEEDLNTDQAAVEPAAVMQDQRGGRKLCSKKRKMSKKSTSRRRRRTSKK